MSDNAPRILVVEDDENLRIALADNLEERGYRVTTTMGAKAALNATQEGTFDLIVLDVMLPDGDGYTLCRELRTRNVPSRILMLTARTLEDDIVRGFESGADDYVTKPYRLRELQARVAALLKRGATPTDAILRFAGFSLDLSARELRAADGHQIELTKTELDLLACLLRNKDRAMTRDQILDSVWGADIVVDGRTVDNFISSLKKKLRWEETSSFRFRSIRGVGYRMEVDGV
jgi:DNA-binding response OmpR family regulator